MRCFCLWQKRCACGTMCAFGTFWIAGRVRKRSVYAQQPRIRANALHLTLCVRLLAMSAAFDFRKCKRLLLSSFAVRALYRGLCGIRTKGDVNGAAHGAHCTFEIALSLAAMLTLMLVCAFFLHASTKVSCVGFIMRCPFREIATLRSQ